MDLSFVIRQRQGKKALPFLLSTFHSIIIDSWNCLKLQACGSVEFGIGRELFQEVEDSFLK